MASVSLAFLQQPDKFLHPMGGADDVSEAMSGDIQHELMEQPSQFTLPADHRLLTTVTGNEFCSAANPDIKFLHGTTTLGFQFSGGVCLAVDSRASMGSYIGSGTVQKVIKISNFLLGTMAGGAADCSFWERNLATQTRVYELREGKRISTAAASKMLANIVYSYRGMGLSMGTMIAGWDDNKGANLYYIDSDGTRLKGDKFSVGSGATYAYGVLDNEYKYDMSVAEAVEVGKRCIWHATHRDAYSGGTINVYVITADGWTHHFAQDMNTLHYGVYAEERAAQTAKTAARKAKEAAAAMKD
jgi:20S proteasome subunit beta 5